MGWTERQRLMLQEMGMRLWAPVAPTEVAATPLPAASAQVRPAAQPARLPAAPAMPAPAAARGRG